SPHPQPSTPEGRGSSDSPLAPVLRGGGSGVRGRSRSATDFLILRFLMCLGRFTGRRPMLIVRRKQCRPQAMDAGNVEKRGQYAKGAQGTDKFLPQSVACLGISFRGEQMQPVADRERIMVLLRSLAGGGLQKLDLVPGVHGADHAGGAHLGSRAAVEAQ